MSRYLVLTVLAAAAAPAGAHAQGWAVEGQTTVLLNVSTVRADRARSVGDQSLLVDASLGASWSDVLDDGTEVQFVAEGRHQTDGVTWAEGARTHEGLETLSLSANGAWGEAVVGWQAGAATRLDARAPSTLERAGAYSPQLDSLGSQDIRARHDATGQAFKLTYLSPRILGIRIGGSYTPEANFQSADFDPEAAFLWSAGAPLEGVWEGGVSFSRSFPDAGVRLRLGLTGSQGQITQGLSERRYSSIGFGAEVGDRSSTLGVRWLRSNGAGSHGDYSALELGVEHIFGVWKIGLETGASKSDRDQGKASSSVLAVRRKMTDTFDLGLGLLTVKSNRADLATPHGLYARGARSGLLLELTVRK